MVSGWPAISRAVTPLLHWFSRYNKVSPIIKGSDGKLRLSPSDMPSSFKVMASGVQKAIRYITFSISVMASNTTSRKAGIILKA